jgi:hypothetical protein
MSFLGEGGGCFLLAFYMKVHQKAGGHVIYSMTYTSVIKVYTGTFSLEGRKVVLQRPSTVGPGLIGPS